MDLSKLKKLPKLIDTKEKKYINTNIVAYNENGEPIHVSNPYDMFEWLCKNNITRFGRVPFETISKNKTLLRREQYSILSAAKQENPRFMIRFMFLEDVEKDNK